MRNTLLAIDEALRLIKQNFSELLDEKFYGLEEKQFILDTRMDVIAGQATEDTEILDARVDANYETHPNLGHNIRNLHSNLLEQEAILGAKSAELREYSEELEVLQNEVSQAGEGILQTNLTLSREIKERRKSDTEISEELKQEQETRASDVHELQNRQELQSELQREIEAVQKHQKEALSILQSQADENASAVLNLACQLHNKAKTKTDDILSWNADMLTVVNAASRYGRHASSSSGGKNYQKQFSMLCLADPHQQWDRVNAGIKYLNAIASIDCGCCLGDLQTNFASDYGFEAGYVDNVLKSTKPFYTVIGNHETGPSTRAKGATLEAIFRKFMQPVAEKTGIENLNRTYYRADWNNYAITLIVLNGYCAPEDTDASGKFIYTDPNNLYFGQEQIDWLISELGTIPTENSLVIMLHMQDFRIQVMDSPFSHEALIGGIYGSTGYPYGKDGILQDIIEAWRTGSKYEHEYVPQDSSGVTETMRVSCDYEQRGAGDFICWLAGHNHRDIIGRSVKYPAQLVIHLCSTGGGATALNSDTPRAETTRAEDALTVFVADKINRSVKLIRIGSNITLGLQERKMTSIAWDYKEPEKEITTKEVLTALNEEIQTRKQEKKYLESFVNMENRDRHSAEELIHEQLKTLGELNIRQELELRDIRQVLKEWIAAANVLYEMAAETGNLTYKGARIASGNEITSMLSDVLSGNDTGEITESEIPEELKDQVSTSEEISEVLSEVFPNN